MAQSGLQISLVPYWEGIQLKRQTGALDPVLMNWLAVAMTLAASLWTGWWLLSGRAGGVWLVLLFVMFTAGFLYRAVELRKVLRSADR